MTSPQPAALSKIGCLANEAQLQTTSESGTEAHAKDAKAAKKARSLGPKPVDLSSGRPLTIRSIPFLMCASPKLIFAPLAFFA